MWSNYLTVGLRALLKNKTYAFINICGLAIGLAACLMILLYVRYEQSYDNWLPNAENVYQVHSVYTDPDTGETGGFQMTAIPAGTTLKKDFPQIERLAYAFSGQAVVYRGGDVSTTDQVLYTHDNLLEVLQLPLVEGDPGQALSRPGSVVLTESEARRQFGDSDALGQTLTLVSRGEHIDHRVTGVIRDLPKNSHIRANMIVRFDPARLFADEPNYASEWGNSKDDSSVDFSPATPDELALLERGMNVMLNEAAARRLGFADPRQAVGAEVSADLIDEGPIPATVVGVVPDVRFGSLRDDVQPILYFRFEMALGEMVLRFSAADPAAVREKAEQVWRRVLPDVPFEGVFVEDELAQLYEADEVRGQVFAIASALAVFIACLGLFGLAAFTVERRRLEIAIRKVFGAGDAAIVRLMVWDFSRPVVIANLIAWPVAWWLMRDWLNNFAARIELHPGWFLGAGLLALLIAVLTVGGHAFQASRTRPALALRYE